MTQNRPSVSPIEILYVEDNAADVRLAQEALREAKVSNRLHVVVDGEQAMAYLRREGKFADAPHIQLVLLDLNLPKKDGREVLAEIKADPDLSRIPVVILTASKAEEDVVRSYTSHANCYITKPVDFNQFQSVVESIKDFWFTVVTLPPDGADHVS